MKNHNILLIDFDNKRRNQISSLLDCYDSCRVDQKSSLLQNEFEQGNYDIVIVHYGNNPEGGCIENEDWDAGSAKIVLFSGSYSQDKHNYDGMFYVNAQYIEDKDNLHKLLDEVLAQ